VFDIMCNISSALMWWGQPGQGSKLYAQSRRDRDSLLLSATHLFRVQNANQAAATAAARLGAAAEADRLLCCRRPRGMTAEWVGAGLGADAGPPARLRRGWAWTRGVNKDAMMGLGRAAEAQRLAWCWRCGQHQDSSDSPGPPAWRPVRGKRLGESRGRVRRRYNWSVRQWSLTSAAASEAVGSLAGGCHCGVEMVTEVAGWHL
jgi:hypothetical protein